MIFSSIIFVLIAIGLLGPLFGGAVAIFAGKRASANHPVQILFALSAIAGLIGTLLVLWNYATGHPAPILLEFSSIPLFHFRVDAWAALFLTIVNAGVLMASVFALGYLPRYVSTYALPSLNLASAFFIVGMQATILASSVLAFLFFWEVMSLSAYFLVIADREELSIRAGLLYLVMTHLGFACLLIGLFTLSGGEPFASLPSLAANLPFLHPQAIAIAFFFLLAGFGSKAGLVPFHQWLPYAHPQAPSHSSALMSGVMLKVALYGFLRFVVLLFPAIPLSWGVIVVSLGILSALFGVLHAAVERDLKRLLAWSSIENMGIIFTAIGLALVFRTLGLSMTPLLIVAIVHAINHFIFKSGLFLSAGAIISETHTRDMNAMGGLAKRWPQFSGWFLGLVFAAAALPPLGTFYGEWMLLQYVGSVISSVSTPTAIALGFVIAVLALVGGLAIFTFANVFSAIFLSRPRSAHAEHAKSLPASLVWPATVCTILSGFVAIGIAPLRGFLQGLIEGSGTANATETILNISGGQISSLLFITTIIVFAVILILLRRMLANRSVRITGTWDCGQAITPKMEYTPTGFSAPIRFFFRSILLAKHQMHAERVSEDNAWILNRRLDWSTHSIWEEWIYRPFAKWILHVSDVAKRLQSGVVQFYLLLIFVTLVIVLVVAL